ncbi:sulfite exporter TauE/SafE family protein [Pandoraea nosoerga]|uniref:Probable membrane transporter protein n=1 Tax=Pandoraea nosoerga TaxID=2508296 RepID=A0A5E4RFY2_9BURK|nr:MULTISPECIES: sulfite exporter TauE/SafE family protein [Pandoraea]MBN4666755.1 sulfite exporter TauE/SafE family protein [Pandoraea nosoerga]MBN4676903.1 sulfite exporter TauE/SafE family protein [Pandoraea nosoerga]MBN4681490.1 sulfite exporter TauE/SafE family protein [Pandoraea nosoerga]MBN4746021.1 sulfite exporter TauE/SafE family protein [Pandoraea nosoerga]VVD61432.1 membrane protein [Pandoraea nosoerga]
MTWHAVLASLPLMALLGFATYFQTVTGFGLGMIVLGGASGFGLAPVASVAILVSLVTLVNSALALPGTWHHIDWRAVRAATLGILPSVVVGVLLFDYLNGAASNVLHLLLGAVILYGGIGSALRPAPKPERASDMGFFFSGIFGGLLSGMFGISGPPLIFYFYRQPLTLVQIRCALILLFAVTALVRTAYSAAAGQLSPAMWWQAAAALPVVTFATLFARRHPPPLSGTTTRRLAFLTLILLGVHLMASAVLEMV